MASKCSIDLRNAVSRETIVEARAIAEKNNVSVNTGGMDASKLEIVFSSWESPQSAADAYRAAVTLKHKMINYYPEFKDKIIIKSNQVDKNARNFILTYPISQADSIYDLVDFRKFKDEQESLLNMYYSGTITQDSTFEDFQKASEQEKATAIAKGLAEKFTKAFNIPYRTITSAEATEILFNSKTPYNNEGAFYYNNVVYIVEGNLNLNSVLHEFSHPLVKAIAIDNPKLFENLYAQVISTATGRDLLEQVIVNYPELGSEDAAEALKEEVIVTALEQAGIDKLNKIKESDPGFENFMKRLLFALKKVLRKMFKKVKLDSLSASTTLEQLADKMILDNDFIVDMPVISEQDFANFKRDLVDVTKDFSEVKSKDLQEMINRSYVQVSTELENLKEAPFRLKQELSGKDGEKILRGLSDSLARYQTLKVNPDQATTDEVLEAMEKHFEEFNKRAQALVNSIDQIETFAETIERSLIEMAATKGHLTQGGISQIQFFKNFIKSNNDFLKNLQDISGLDKTNNFFKRINAVRNTTESAFGMLKKLEKEFVIEFIGDESSVMMDSIEENLETRLGLIFDANNVPQSVREAVLDKIRSNNEGSIDIAELHKLGLPKNLPKSSRKTLGDQINLYYAKRLNAEQIDQFISGQRGDLDTLSAFLVPYKNIDDPIVGSYARWLSIQMSEAQSKSLKRKNEMANELLPLLRAFGYKPNDTGQLGKALLMKDKIWVVNKEGKWEEQEVLTFINEFKNYRAERGKLQTAFDEARESKDKEAMKEAFKNLVEFDEKYMHRKYTKEYYDLQKMWKQDNVVRNPITGKDEIISAQLSFEAFLERQHGLDKLNLTSNKHFTELEDVQSFSESDLARQEYDQLFNLKNEDGTDKQGDELLKTLLRRKYRSESRKFYEYKTDESKVQQDLNAFVENLAAKNISYEENREEFDMELEKFKKKNFKLFFEPAYFEEKAQIIENIKALTQKQSEQSVPKKMSNLYEERYNIRLTKLDANGQPNGTQYTKEQIERLKEIEEELITLREEWNTAAGLTETELEQYQALDKALANGAKLTEEQEKRYYDLDNRRALYGLNQLDYVRLKQEFKKLSEIKEVRPTDYYVQTFNFFLSDMEASPLTLENADSYIQDTELLNRLRSEYGEDSVNFDQWFTKNHYRATQYVPGQGKIKVWKRLDVWNISRPSNPDYIKKTTLIHPITKEEMIVEGVPSGKYSYSVVKDEYRTIPRGANIKNYVGKVVDNKGNFLPRLDAEDKRFINQEYFDLKKENGARFKLLEKIKQLHLENQETTTRGTKLYLDLPRYRKRNNLEYLQSGEAAATLNEKVKAAKDEIKSAFSKNTPPDSEKFGLNYNADARFVTTDLTGQPISRIQVSGLYNMPVQSVSEDVLPAIYEYLSSVNQFEKLRETEATSKTLLSVLNDPKNDIKDMSKASKQMAKFSSKLSFLPKGSDNRRAKTIEYLMEKVYYGKANDQLSEEYPALTKMANMMMGMASRSFIALDVPSALKNRYGMIFQSMIEAAASDYLDPVSLAYGRGKAFTNMIELSSKGIYERGAPSLDMQILEYFDPVTGKVKKDFGKSSSRTFLKDMLDGTFLYDFRRYAEVEASLQVFWAMMKKKKVKLKQPNGEETLISYKDAFELDENKQLKLKDGVDLAYSPVPIEHDVTADDTLESLSEKYNVDIETLEKLNRGMDLKNLSPGDKIVITKGALFSDFKLKIEGMGKKLNGMVNDLDSPQANKYLLYRLMFFYRKFATGMFLNRFQADMSKDNRWGAVYDWDFGTLSKGYYISAFQAIKKVITDPANAWKILSKEEKQGMGKVGTELGGLILISMILGMVFGYDPGDEDRFEKMKQREEDYGTLGYLANHMLYQLMMVKQENEAFVPVLGFDEWLSYTKQMSIATGPTLDLYVKIMNDLSNMAFGSEKAVYKRDVGPYSWQTEGSYKLWNHLFSLFGIKGKTYDPIHAIKAAETFQNLR